MKSKLSFEILLISIIVLPLIYIATIWSTIPQIIPTHFGLSGEPDDWGSKWTLFIMPAFSVPLYFILRFIPRIDPRFKNYQMFQRSYNYIRLAVQVLLSGISVVVLQMTLHQSLAQIGGKWIMIPVLLFFSVIGNFMRTLRSNYFAGIRTPWTLENEEVWRRTHEVGGRLWFYGGLILAFVSVFLPDIAVICIAFPGILIMAIYPMVYSYTCYKKLKAENASSGNQSSRS